MSIDAILIAINKVRDYRPDLTNITQIYESVIGAVVFPLEDSRDLMYDIENDILTVLEDLY